MPLPPPPASRPRGVAGSPGRVPDEEGEYLAGTFCRFEDGSSHHPIALDTGVACVFFAIAGEGIELFEDDQDQA